MAIYFIFFSLFAQQTISNYRKALMAPLAQSLYSVEEHNSDMNPQRLCIFLWNLTEKPQVLSLSLLQHTLSFQLLHFFQYAERDWETLQRENTSAISASFCLQDCCFCLWQTHANIHKHVATGARFIAKCLCTKTFSSFNGWTWLCAVTLITMFI